MTQADFILQLFQHTQMLFGSSSKHFWEQTWSLWEKVILIKRTKEAEKTFSSSSLHASHLLQTDVSYQLSFMQECIASNIFHLSNKKSLKRSHSSAIFSFLLHLFKVLFLLCFDSVSLCAWWFSIIVFLLSFNFFSFLFG